MLESNNSSEAPKEQAVRAWLLDLDGTLYRARPVKLRMALSLCFCSPQTLRILRQFRREHEKLRRDMSEPDHAISTPTGQLHTQSASSCPSSPYDQQILRTAKQTNLSPELIRQSVEEWMFERPSLLLRRYRNECLVEELREFRQCGGKTALVSDYPAIRKLNALQLNDCFDAVVANGEPGGPFRLKPDPEGYLRAAQRLNIPRAACLVIGDRPDADGKAAAAAGMRFRRV